VNLSSGTTPAGGCATGASDAVAPFIVQTSPVVSTGNNVTVVGSREVVAFDGLGRQTGTTNPNSAAATLTIEVGSTVGTCAASGGSVRCMRVVLTPGGEARICDPARTASNDSMKCP
jgi:type IV fimbrial biogenesis protein FimT